MLYNGRHGALKQFLNPLKFTDPHQGTVIRPVIPELQATASVHAGSAQPALTRGLMRKKMTEEWEKEVERQKQDAEKQEAEKQEMERQEAEKQEAEKQAADKQISEQKLETQVTDEAAPAPPERASSSKDTAEATQPVFLEKQEEKMDTTSDARTAEAPSTTEVQRASHPRDPRDVRAEPQSPPPAAKAKTPAKKMTLSDYLKKKKKNLN